MGWAEIGVLFVLALLIFGPDKLPKFASDAAGMLRKLRELAQNAQTGLTDQGIDVQGIKTDLQSVAELHPKRIMGSVVSDLNAASTPVASAAAATSPTASEVSPTESSTDKSEAAPRPSASEEAATPAVKNIPQPNTKFDPDAT